MVFERDARFNHPPSEGSMEIYGWLPRARLRLTLGYFQSPDCVRLNGCQQTSSGYLSALRRSSTDQAIGPFFCFGSRDSNRISRISWIAKVAEKSATILVCLTRGGP